MTSDDDVDSVIMISIGKPPTEAQYNFYYVMGFTTKAPMPSIIGDVRTLHINTKSSAVEMVLAKGVTADFLCREDGWSEQQWERFVEDNVEGKIIRVQTSCSISKDDGGAACIDRIIGMHCKTMQPMQREQPVVTMQPDVLNMQPDDGAGQQGGTMSNDLFNCYREASGGRMHYMDRRPWKMSTIAQLGMEYELSSTRQRISLLTIKARDANARIQYTHAALQCAKIIDPEVADLLEEDLHKLESQEAEIMCEVATLHDVAHQHTSVLQFQQQLARITSRKRARSDDE
jgi:hypothetical protein